MKLVEKNHNGFGVIVIIVAVAVLVLLIGGGWFAQQYGPFILKSGGPLCTQEAKLCPDGKTYVSRTGPNCEFAECSVNGQMWIRASFPSGYKHTIEIWHPDNWIFNCCGDKDTESNHVLYPQVAGEAPPFRIVVTDYALVGPSKGTIDSPVRVSVVEKVELLRQALLVNAEEFSREKVKNFTAEAYVFKSAGSDSRPSKETYLINTDSGVVKVTFENSQKLGEEVIKDFLDHLEPATGVNTSTWKTYRNAQYGFEVRYPNSWTVDDSKDSILFQDKGSTVISLSFGDLTILGITHCAAYPQDKRCEALGNEIMIDWGGVGIGSPSALTSREQVGFFFTMHSSTEEAKNIFRKFLSTFKFIR